MKPFKIYVNPQESENVQQILFDNGYSWRSGEKRIKYTDQNYLFFTERGLTCDNPDHIKFSGMIEFTYNEFLRYVLNTQRKDKLKNLENEIRI